MADQLEAVQKGLAARYEVYRALGRGGMASVYLGRDCASDDLVAIKVLRPEFAATLGGDRFHREISILKSLNHPNILPLLDSGDTKAFVYYAMPYAEGGSLSTRLKDKKTLPLEEVVAIAGDIAAGLDYAHGENVVHRDIKPANILFDAERATLCDFGVARAVIKAAGDRISSSGLVVGTPAYMSPEQASGSPEIDGRSDLYALGCVIFEMLIGEPPFTGKSAQSIMARQVRERPPSLRVVRSELPQHVDEAVHQALSKDPAKRPASGQAFVEQLAAPA